MIAASKLGGYFAAHAIWCVSDGETLIPMLAYTTGDEERRMERLVNDDLAASVQLGKERLDSNAMDANDAVLLYDGRITLGDEKVDAIIVEMRAYFAPGAEAMIAVPYTPAGADGFRVHRPKLIAWDNCEDFDMDTALQCFFEGVDGHEEGAKVWNDALDESR